MRSASGGVPWPAAWCARRDAASSNVGEFCGTGFFAIGIEAQT
jgi:hypothetical protein